jgi:hypothetical protein
MEARRARRRPQRREALPEEGTSGEEGRRGGAHLVAGVRERRATATEWRAWATATEWTLTE